MSRSKSEFVPKDESTFIYVFFLFQFDRRYFIDPSGLASDGYMLYGSTVESGRS